MWKNLFVTALRHLRRNRGYAAVDVLGLAAGMACCLMMILLYVGDELRYDRFHERAERIYRVAAGTGGDGQPTNANGAFSALALFIACLGGAGRLRRAAAARGDRRAQGTRRERAGPAGGRADAGPGAGVGERARPPRRAANPADTLRYE